MAKLISENSRKALFSSLGSVEAHRPAIVAALAGSLAADAEGEDRDRSELIVILLMDMLVEQARYLSQGRPPQDLHDHVVRHERNGISGRHYSRFGDALVPVLRDVIGPGLPRSVANAWVDAFWLVIQTATLGEQERELEPVQRAAAGLR